MRKRLAIFVVIAAGLVSPVAAPAAVGPTFTHRAACGAGYVAANLPWGHKCLRAGEFCKIGNRAYARYGFTCPSTGHLRRR